MIEIQITPQMIEDARERMKHGKLRGSVTEGERNTIGYLGEEIFQKHFKTAKRENTFDYDFILENSRIDVKASQVPHYPQPYYNNDVYAFNTKQECDCYVFAQIHKDRTKGWLIGYLPKKEFFEVAKLYKRGEPAPNNKNFILRGDSYIVRNDQLRKFK